MMFDLATNENEWQSCQTVHAIQFRPQAAQLRVT